MNSPTTFYLNQLNTLVGGKISALARTGVPNDQEDDELFGLVITFPNGSKKTLLLMSDDEGNGPGSFEILSDQ